MNRTLPFTTARALAWLVLTLSVVHTSVAAETLAPQRVITVGASITEIAFALDAGDNIVAVDTTSTFPSSAQVLPKVGYQRTLAAEGILSLRPDLLLVNDEAGPPPALDQVRAAGIRVVVLPQARTAAATGALIRGVGKALERTVASEQLADEVERELEQAVATDILASARPRVIFLHAMGSGPMLAGGKATVANELIRLAGGSNAAGDFEGFKPLSAEALVAADPQVVLVSQRGLASIGGVDGLLAAPGLATTQAARERRVVTLDDTHLLGFGPRSGAAVTSLRHQLSETANAGEASQ